MQYLHYLSYLHIAATVAVLVLALSARTKILNFISALLALYCSYCLLNSYPQAYFIFGFLWSVAYLINLMFSGVLKTKEKFLFDLMDVFAAFIICLLSILFWTQMILASNFAKNKLQNQNPE